MSRTAVSDDESLSRFAETLAQLLVPQKSASEMFSLIHRQQPSDFIFVLQNQNESGQRAAEHVEQHAD